MIGLLTTPVVIGIIIGLACQPIKSRITKRQDRASIPYVGRP